MSYICIMVIELVAGEFIEAGSPVQIRDGKVYGADLKIFSPIGEDKPDFTSVYDLVDAFKERFLFTSIPQALLVPVPVPVLPYSLGLNDTIG